MLVGCEGDVLFFSSVVSGIHSHFEILFDSGSEEDEEDIEDETGGEGSQKQDQGIGGAFQQFGLLPLILRVCEHSNSSFDVVMDWSVCQTFYIASYIITKNRYDENQIKQMQMRNGIR